MKALHGLLHGFNEQEISCIRAIINSGREENDTKYLQLFEIVLSTAKPPTRKEVARVLYKSIPDSRITKLASRLEDKVLEIIISTRFLEQNKRIIDYNMRNIRLRKRQAHCQALYAMDFRKAQTKRIYDKAIAEALPTGAFLPLIEFYNARRSCESMNKKRYDDYTSKINFYWRCYQASEMVLDSYWEIVRLSTYPRSLSNDKKISLFKRIIKRIDQNRRFIINSKSQMQVERIKIAYYQYTKQYKYAQKVIVAAIRNAEQKMPEYVTYSARFITEYATCEALQGRYATSAKRFNEACDIFKRSEATNYLITLIASFHPVFYLLRYDKAQKITEELEVAASSYPSDIRFAKYTYYRACIQFQKANFHAVIRTLSESLDLNKDKVGHDFSIRVLRIQSLIMLHKFDEASAAIQALRKHVSRYTRKFHLSSRDKAMLKILLLAERRGFSGSAKKSESDLVEKLKAKKGEYVWEPFTNELIKFHEWYNESPLTKARQPALKQKRLSR
jgi:hypothetical protein